MSKAQKHGFYYGNNIWANLGQGAPETGEIENSPKRLTEFVLDNALAEYSPIAGDKALREAVANLYNHRYRRDHASKYSHENVAISSGGRAALCRIAATLSNINLGHFLPDYTAYEELLDVFNGFVPIPISHASASGFKPNIDAMKKAMINMGLGAMLLSNPSNPSGQVIAGQSLKRLVNSSQAVGCSMIFDEFYSHYLYRGKQTSVSAARFVENVDKDSVLIVDGLTKNWRYPGLRIAWTLGPKNIIESIASAGSFLDGGAAHAIQKAIMQLLAPKHAAFEAKSIQKVFIKKRDYMVNRLKQLGFLLPAGAPEGGFYCFPCLKNLPQPLQNGMAFFNTLLERKVICVPGIFFDVNPGNRRNKMHARLENYVRFSFGPPMGEIALGLERIESLIQDYKT